jgi:hypothetical protein
VTRIRAHAPTLGGLPERGTEILQERVAGLGVRGDEERGRITELGNELRADDGRCAAAQAGDTHSATSLGDASRNVV